MQMFMNVTVYLSWLSQNKVFDIKLLVLLIQYKFAKSLTIKNTPQYRHHSKTKLFKAMNINKMLFVFFNFLNRCYHFESQITNEVWFSDVLLSEIWTFWLFWDTIPNPDHSMIRHVLTTWIPNTFRCKIRTLSEPIELSLHQRFYIWNKISKGFWFIVEMGFFFKIFFEFFFSVSWTSNFCYCFSPSHSFQGWTIFIF